METTERNQQRVADFQRRVAAGEPPAPGEPATAGEALEMLQERHGGEVFGPEVRAMIARIDAAERAAATAAAG